MISVYIEGIGLCAPGMRDWATGCAVLRGDVASNNELPKPTADILPPAERRRSGLATRYALEVAQQAMAQSGLAPTEVAAVFTSSDGDGENLHHILESLALPEHEVSPTRFHNSVHNAAAGYWNIATGARTPANSLAAFDNSFAAGLLEAAVQVAAENIPVLLVAFDLPYLPPLHQVRPIPAPFAVALLLTPQATAKGTARLQISLTDQSSAVTKMAVQELETLRAGNPAAHSLPLLQAIAQGCAASIVVAYGNNNLIVEIVDENR